MAVGPKVKKWNWLLDNVEVKGIVRESGVLEDQDIAGDEIDIEVDDNYKHFVNYVPGFGPFVHCETYPEKISDNSDFINRVEPWPLPKKPTGEPFTVFDPIKGQRQNLRVGDHVRVVGRWLIENGHPANRYQLGLYQAGNVFVEFHPFDWQNIQLVTPTPVMGTTIETVSVAAPLYEAIYPGSYWWNRIRGRAEKLYITDGGGNFHTSVTASAYIQAPALPQGQLPKADLIEFKEEVLVNGTGLPLEEVRTISVVDDGIQVKVTVSSPPVQNFDGVTIADFNDPANNKSIFQARYMVKWKSISIISAIAPLLLTDAPISGTGAASTL